MNSAQVLEQWYSNPMNTNYFSINHDSQNRLTKLPLLTEFEFIRSSYLHRNKTTQTPC